MSVDDQAVTKRDIAELRSELGQLRSELRSELASKADLERFASKADLEKFASKADLEKFASKAELAAMAEQLRSELASKADLDKLASKAELAAMAEQLRSELASKADLAGLEKRLLFEIGHALNVAVEQIGSKVAVLDDKFDAPVRQLRSDLDEHRRDVTVHRRPPSPKRTRTR